MARKSTVIVGALAVVALTACTTTTNPGGATNAQTGAATGALIGGLLGVVTGDNSSERLRRGAIGAVAGAAVGGLIGSNLDAQAAELRRDLGGSYGVTNTGEELIVSMPQDVLFATDSAVVRPENFANLRTIAESLRRYPDTRVEIVGHTDSTGDAGYNQRLSERRAAAVADVLRGEGVGGARIVAFGRGEDSPIATNLTPEGRAQNRRVEIIIRPNG